MTVLVFLAGGAVFGTFAWIAGVAVGLRQAAQISGESFDAGFQAGRDSVPRDNVVPPRRRAP